MERADMIDFLAELPKTLAWAKKHTLASIICVVLGISAYIGTEFVSGMANQAGGRVAGEYLSFKKSVSSNSIIDAILQKHLTQFSGSRISIGRFHDTQKDIANNHLFYVTFSSILGAPGVTTDMANLKDLPIAIYSNVLPDLIANKAHFSYERDLQEGALKDMMKHRGTKAAMYFPINGLNGDTMGMMVISWMNEADIPDKSDQDKMRPVLMDSATRIGAYFEGRNQ